MVVLERECIQQEHQVLLRHRHRAVLDLVAALVSQLVEAVHRRAAVVVLVESEETVS
jgi:16S rRNA G966 N2-methylase RsmD